MVLQQLLLQAPQLPQLHRYIHEHEIFLGLALHCREHQHTSHPTKACICLDFPPCNCCYVIRRELVSRF
jgi:hypothetical protein